MIILVPYSHILGLQFQQGLVLGDDHLDDLLMVIVRRLMDGRPAFLVRRQHIGVVCQQARDSVQTAAFGG